ncbi:MAG: peroxiredoxin family protein [Patescibacteria group bacterium]
MNLKDWIFTIIGTGILVALIVIIGQKGSPPAVQQSSGGDSMHGSSQPADSKIFNNLVGKTAPDFTLESYSGEKFTLSFLKGKNVILFFNEGLMCYPSCWNQVAAFGKDLQFKDKNIIVLNITVDPKKDWQEAVGKMPDLAAATVLLDTDKKISTLYGVLTLPSSMHRGQFPGHSYIVIDKKGVVRFVHDDTEMAIRNKELANEVETL